jgi:hypothetical protein
MIFQRQILIPFLKTVSSSLFEFEKYGDNDYGSMENSQSDHHQHHPHHRPRTTEKLNDGKLEKSFLNFHQNYPTVNPGNTTIPFMDRMDTYKSMMFVVSFHLAFCLFLTVFGFSFSRKTKKEREFSNLLEKSLFRSGNNGIGSMIKSPGLFRQNSFTQHSHYHNQLETHPEEQEQQQQPDILIPRATSSDENAPPSLGIAGEAEQSPLTLKFPMQIVGSETPDYTKGTFSPMKTMTNSDYFPFGGGQQNNNKGDNLIRDIPPPPPRVKSISDESLRGTHSGHMAKIDRINSYSSMPRTSAILGMKSPQKLPRGKYTGSSSILYSSKFPNFPSQQSLFERNQLLSGGGSNQQQATSLEDMPSVLLSVFNQQNIDYQNDFYWLEKFRRDKIAFNGNNEFEKSIMEFKQQQEHNSTLPTGIYAANINKNVVSSPKYTAANRKTFNNNNNNNNSNNSHHNNNNNSNYNSVENTALPTPRTTVNDSANLSPTNSNNKNNNNSNTNNDVGLQISNPLHQVTSMEGTASRSNEITNSLSMEHVKSTSNPEFIPEFLTKNTISNHKLMGLSPERMNAPLGDYYPFTSESKMYDENPFQSQQHPVGEDEDDSSKANEKSVLLTRINKDKH